MIMCYGDYSVKKFGFATVRMKNKVGMTSGLLFALNGIHTPNAFLKSKML